MPRRPATRAALEPVEEELGETSVSASALDPSAFRTHAVRINPSKASRKKARAEKMLKRRQQIEAAKKYLDDRYGHASASRNLGPVEEPASGDESSSSGSSVMSDEELIMNVASGSTNAPSSRSPDRVVASGPPESQTTPPGIEHAASSSRRQAQRSVSQSGSSSASTIPRRPRETIEEYAQTMSMLVMDDVEEAPMLLPRQRRFSNRTLLPRKPTKAVKKLDYAARMLATELSLTTHNNGLLSACVHSACGSLCYGPRLLNLFQRYWRYRTEAKRLVFLTSFMVYKQEEGKHCFIQLVN